MNQTDMQKYRNLASDAFINNGLCWELTTKAAGGQHRQTEPPSEYLRSACIAPWRVGPRVGSSCHSDYYWTSQGARQPFRRLLIRGKLLEMHQAVW